MSIINFSVDTLSGALNACTSTAEIRVSKTEKAKVVMDGYIGAGRVKKGDEYVPGAFGRLPLQAALVGEGEKARLVLDIAGGLRGVLFRNDRKEGDKDPDYTGNLEVGDQEYGLFGRKVTTENGSFISLSSTEARAKQQRRGNGNGNGNGDNANQHADPSYGENFSNSDDIPFAPLRGRTYF